MANHTTLSSLLVSALVISALSQPSIQWHGIYDDEGDVAEGPTALRVSNGSGTSRAVQPCLPFASLHILAVGGPRLLAVGCADVCLTGDCSSPVARGERFGLQWESTDEGLTWSQPDPRVARNALLQTSGATAVTVPSQGAGAPSLHCLIGGLLVPSPPDVPSADMQGSLQVVCTMDDGGSWTAQAEPLPAPRVVATALVWTLPQEQHPRIFLFGGSSGSTVGHHPWGPLLLPLGPSCPPLWCSPRHPRNHMQMGRHSWWEAGARWTLCPPSCATESSLSPLTGRPVCPSVTSLGTTSGRDRGHVAWC